MDIMIKNFDGSTIRLYVESNDSILSVKNQIQQITGILENQQRIIFAGHQLQDGNTLSDYRIHQSSTLHLVLRVRGGGCEFNFNSLQNKKELTFSRSAPDYRTISPGLILLAICQKESCKAFNQQVCIQKGFGTFHIGKEIYKCVCPVCKKPTRESTNLGYYQTRIKFQGRQKDGKYINREETAQNGKFISFQNSDGDIRSWNYLEITTERLR